MEQKFAVAIIAAGASTRLGRPKQLLVFNGKTLIENVAQAALESGASQTVVVVGAVESPIREVLANLPIDIVVNELWRGGMGSSIACSVRALSTELECVVIALCDQPKVTSSHLSTLARRQLETGADIVASEYEGVKGAPCAFGSSMFAKLSSLTGDKGARELIRNSAAFVETVVLDGGSLDIDSEEDLKLLSTDG